MSLMFNVVRGPDRPLGGMPAPFSLQEPTAGSTHLEKRIVELRALAALPTFLEQSVGVILPTRPRDYARFWDLAREVAAMFRSTYLNLADRERLWNDYSDICQQVKELSRAEREARAATSAVNAGRVQAYLREAVHWIRGGETNADLAEARAQLGKAMDILRTADFLHQDRQRCFAA